MDRQDRVIAFFRAGKAAFDAKTGGAYYGYPPSPYESKNQRLNRGRGGLVKEPGVKRLSTDGTAIYSYEHWLLIQRLPDGTLRFGPKMYERPYGPTTKRHMELVYHAFKNEVPDQEVPESVYHQLASTMETCARHGDSASVIRRKLLRDAPLFHTVDWSRVFFKAGTLAVKRNPKSAIDALEAKLSKALVLTLKAEEDAEAWRNRYRAMMAA